ncbi:MAG: TonB-dependent receptor, partial [Ignavibacteria bacterium]|nr:TonB-dependent receptor [Ignavibacteria bacterium]
SVAMRYNGESRTDNFGNMLNTDAGIINHLRNDYGGFYSDNKLDAFTVFNADISYTINNILSLQDLKIQAQVINLFNKLYAAGAEGKEFFPAAERSIFIGIELGF